MTEECHPITDDDWDDIKKMMETPLGRAKLIVDGFELDLVQQVRKRKVVTRIYVNKELKQDWLMPLKDGGTEAKHEEGRRFLMPRSQSVYTAKEIKDIQKICGKRDAKRCAKQRIYWFSPEWKSPRSLRKHLELNNKEILVVKVEYLAT